MPVNDTNRKGLTNIALRNLYYTNRDYAKLGYDELAANEQAKAYTEHIGRGPLVGLLQLARAKKLSLAGLRRRFKQPDKAAAFAASLGLNSGQGGDEAA